MGLSPALTALLECGLHLVTHLQRQRMDREKSGVKGLLRALIFGEVPIPQTSQQWPSLMGGLRPCVSSSGTPLQELTPPLSPGSLEHVLRPDVSRDSWTSRPTSLSLN